jgi:hypothetical protein
LFPAKGSEIAENGLAADGITFHDAYRVTDQEDSGENGVNHSIELSATRTRLLRGGGLRRPLKLGDSRLEIGVFRA